MRVLQHLLPVCHSLGPVALVKTAPQVLNGAATKGVISDEGVAACLTCLGIAGTSSIGKNCSPSLEWGCHKRGDIWWGCSPCVDEATFVSHLVSEFHALNCCWNTCSYHWRTSFSLCWYIRWPHNRGEFGISHWNIEVFPLLIPSIFYQVGGGQSQLQKHFRSNKVLLLIR